MVVLAPPMFMSAVKETDEELDSERAKLDEQPLPPCALHQLVPVESGNKRKQQAADQEPELSVVPNVKFKFSKKDERVKTKHMMLGLQLSLNKLLGFRWSDTVPLVPLRPLQPGETRMIHECSRTGQKMVYYFSSESGEVVWQSGETEAFKKHLRLASVMDEGSSNYSLFAALAEHCAVLPLRDSMHKMARVQDLTFASHPALLEFKREIFVCLKLDRAPWSTSRFGRRLKEAAADYATSMDPSSDPLLSPLIASIAQDTGLSGDDCNAIMAAILGFAKGESRGMSSDYSMGRWESFFDGGRILLRQEVVNH